MGVATEGKTVTGPVNIQPTYGSKHLPLSEKEVEVRFLSFAHAACKTFLSKMWLTAGNFCIKGRGKGHTGPPIPTFMTILCSLELSQQR